MIRFSLPSQVVPLEPESEGEMFLCDLSTRHVGPLWVKPEASGSASTRSTDVPLGQG